MNSWQKSTLVSPELPWQWLPAGSDGDGGDGDADAGDTQDDQDGRDDSEDGDGSGDDEQFTREQYQALQRKYEAQRTQLQAADRNKSAAQKELDELKRKERTDLENAQADAKKAIEAEGLWKTKYENLARTNAFLIESARAKVQWHDPAVAMAAAKLTDLTIGEDGEVEGMDVLIKKLAKEKAFLVSDGATETDGDSGDGRRVTGSKVGGKRGTTNGGKPGQLSEEELKRRFPALR